jgi:hypothetical protein
MSLYKVSGSESIETSLNTVFLKYIPSVYHNKFEKGIQLRKQRKCGRKCGSQA